MPSCTREGPADRTRDPVPERARPSATRRSSERTGQTGLRLRPETPRTGKGEPGRTGRGGSYPRPGHSGRHDEPPRMHRGRQQPPRRCQPTRRTDLDERFRMGHTRRGHRRGYSTRARVVLDLEFQPRSYANGGSRSSWQASARTGQNEPPSQQPWKPTQAVTAAKPVTPCETTLRTVAGRWTARSAGVERFVERVTG